MNTPRSLFLGGLLALMAIGAGAATNSVLTFRADKRAGVEVFLDECLAKGITNSIELPELRLWATNLLTRYDNSKLNRIPASEIPSKIKNIPAKTPSCQFSSPETPDDYHEIHPGNPSLSATIIRDAGGKAEAVSVFWNPYGILIAGEAFELRRQNEPWFSRKLADGIFLWHGYK